MFPFWKTVVEPIMAASRARRVLEIGALRGETTVLALDTLDPAAELHVIDPLPEFDPTEHERRFPGRYIFHRDLSLNVLPDAPAFDLALIDGDHNWYTVYNELRLLAERARRAAQSLPVLVLHDVCWPYGRRDLYYEPSQIPDEFRRPYARRGMRPGRKQLLRGGGFNVGLANALEEGGPRNGVMTALEDFMAEHDRPLRRVVLPIYFGLAIVAEEELLATRPELSALLDDLESPAGTRRLLELSEAIRVDEAVFGHNIERVREERIRLADDRYLSLLRDALVGERYLADESDIEQLDQALRTIVDQRVEGDLVDCGAGRGGGAIYLRGFLETLEASGRSVWVADRFRVSPNDAGATAVGEVRVDDLSANLNQVREAFDRFGLLDERVRFLQGLFGDASVDATIDSIALLRIGSSTGDETATVLEHLYGRVTRGGFVIVEDASGSTGVAVEEFRRRHGITEELQRVGTTGFAWHKGRDIAADGVPPADSQPGTRIGN